MTVQFDYRELAKATNHTASLLYTSSWCVAVFTAFHPTRSARHGGHVHDGICACDAGHLHAALPHASIARRNASNGLRHIDLSRVPPGTMLAATCAGVAAS